MSANLPLAPPHKLEVQISSVCALLKAREDIRPGCCWPLHGRAAVSPTRSALLRAWLAARPAAVARVARSNMGCGGSTAIHQIEAKEAEEVLVAVVPDGGPHQETKETPLVPHFGPSHMKQQNVSSLFKGKHAMLTYQWDAQEKVKAVRNLLQSHGVPTWMDIDGKPAPCSDVCLLPAPPRA